MQLRSFRERFTKCQIRHRRNRISDRLYRITGRDPIFTKSDVRIMLIHCWNMSRNMVISVTS